TCPSLSRGSGSTLYYAWAILKISSRGWENRMSLRNRVALVTGGSRGIGRGLALRLAQDGARIAIAYRSNKVAAQQTLRQLQAGGADCVAVETDITDSNGCDRLIKTVADRYGRLDIVVNNVGD